MVREEQGLDLNAKLSKELRRYVEQFSEPNSSVRKLLAKPVALKSGGHAVVAINGRQTIRGAYRELKRAVERHPEILEQLRTTAAYKRMLAAEQKAGGPTFDRGQDELGNQQVG